MIDELRRQLENAYQEEVNDHHKYMELAKMAEDHECHEAYKVLKDIAHEEHTHAEAISALLGHN